MAHVILYKGATCLLLLFLVLFKPAYAHDKVDEYEEISVLLYTPRLGSTELSAVINGHSVYLHVTDLFNFLKIKNTASVSLDSVSGFIADPQANFLIERIRNRVTYQNKAFDLGASDIVYTDMGIYLKSDHFGKIFGLDCSFNYRSLSVTLTSKFELPAVREMQQELMRKNINKLKGEAEADTTYSRKFELINFGAADWAVTAMQTPDGRNNALFNLRLGAILAGGEAEASFNYDKDQPLSRKYQFYRWRFVDNEKAAIKQFTVGKTFVPSISTLFAPVTGIQLTNAPTTFRRSFGTYTHSNTTEPGWVVELYVNNVLIDYTKADASGFYTFEVPMVYGNSVVTLRFYGPWGEERVSEQNIIIPFHFLPQHQFEYTLNSGIVENEDKSRFLRFNSNYGLARNVTVGAGVEYISSAYSSSNIPFISASMRLGNMLLSGEHAYGIRSKSTMSYRLPHNLQVELNYTSYNREQRVVRFNYHEELKAVASIPFRAGNFTAISRLSVNQVTHSESKFTIAEFMLSGGTAGINSNLTTNAAFNESGKAFIYSNLSMAFRLPAGIRFTPHLQYGFSEKNFNRIRGEAEKKVLENGYLNVSYEHNSFSKINSFGVGFRYDFSFAQTSFFATRHSTRTVTAQSARGSLIYDNKNKHFEGTNQSSVGRGGIVVSPFLDINCNGRRDYNEPKAPGLTLRTYGGRIDYNDKDTTIRISGLEPYINYVITLDETNFENISWQIKNPLISVPVEPNTFRLIEVPVSVLGEATGYIYLKDNNEISGIGRIKINFHDVNSVIVAKAISENDGYFSYMGLPPGKYTARADTNQLKQLNMSIDSTEFPFEIYTTLDGDYVDNIKIVLTPKNSINRTVLDKFIEETQKQSSSGFHSVSRNSDVESETGVELPKSSNNSVATSPSPVFTNSNQPDSLVAADSNAVIEHLGQNSEKSPGSSEISFDEFIKMNASYLSWLGMIYESMLLSWLIILIIIWRKKRSVQD